MIATLAHRSRRPTTGSHSAPPVPLASVGGIRWGCCDWSKNEASAHAYSAGAPNPSDVFSQVSDNDLTSCVESRYSVWRVPSQGSTPPHLSVPG